MNPIEVDSWGVCPEDTKVIGADPSSVESKGVLPADADPLGADRANCGGDVGEFFVRARDGVVSPCGDV